MGKLFIKEYYLKFILYLAVIILINIVGLTLFFRSDLTANKIYSLSRGQQISGIDPVRAIDHQGLFLPEPARPPQQHRTVSSGPAHRVRRLRGTVL